jgi:hypothetical protein
MADGPKDGVALIAAIVDVLQRVLTLSRYELYRHFVTDRRAVRPCRRDVQLVVLHGAMPRAHHSPSATASMTWPARSPNIVIDLGGYDH